ncbi:MAG: L,D-transpeptidase family protein [Ferruginibacter sp.]
MMKKLFFALVLIPALIACNNNGTNSDGSESSSSSSSKSEKDKKISKRDFSINASNAYNNLFFDSSALEKFITEEKVSDSISRRMRSFYNTRNYQYAWFSPDGLTEQARGFWNMHSYHTTYTNDSALKDKVLQKKMDGLIEDEFSVSASDKSILKTELTLTEHFILYALNNIEDGYLKRKEMERFIPRRKEDPIMLADSLLAKKHKDNKYYEDVNENYKKLKAVMEQYVGIQKAGGWPVMDVSVKKIKTGAAIALLKKRLQLSGDMPGIDTSAVFNDSLKNAIMNFQQRHGYTADGKLTDAQLKDMNVPVIKRIEQILINMGRMQWMVTNPSGRRIVVNIPEYILHVTKDGAKDFDMNVVVGKDGHNTVMFTGNLNQVVFSPYWNVPASIVKNELLPKMASNPDYLASQEMEINGQDGDLPSIRQLPGDKNALGRVKFLFPNSFNIYFHDTPSKSLFNNDKRAYSHGCIRLSDPVKMANYVLQDDPEWTPSKIEDAMNAGVEKYVKVKKSIPVLITYYTAWVDDAGQLHFADDIYNHDTPLAAKMFTGSY